MPGTEPIKHPVEPLEKTITYMVNYLKSTDKHDVSPSGLLNWFSQRRKNFGERVFDDGGLINRTEYSEAFEEALSAAIDKESMGRALDFLIMGVSNDIIAQIEMAANFRNTKIAHHFAQSLYNIEQLSTGAQEPKGSDSILEEYTTTFVNNAIKRVEYRSDAQE